MSFEQYKKDLPSEVAIEGDDENQAAKLKIPIPKPIQVSLPKWSTWTNDAAKLDLSTYFDPNKPNISTDFGVDGLQPVVRDTEGGLFLLQDSGSRFYRWSIWEGLLLRLIDLNSLAAAVEAIMRDSGTLRMSLVWSDDRKE